MNENVKAALDLLRKEGYSVDPLPVVSETENAQQVGTSLTDLFHRLADAVFTSHGEREAFKQVVAEVLDNL